MDKRGVETLISNQFKLGADAGVAAGPVGRDAQAATDETERTLWFMRAERWLRLAREASSKAANEPLTPYLVAELEQSNEVSAGSPPPAQR